MATTSFMFPWTGATTGLAPYLCLSYYLLLSSASLATPLIYLSPTVGPIKLHARAAAEFTMTDA